MIEATYFATISFYKYAIRMNTKSISEYFQQQWTLKKN